MKVTFDIECTPEEARAFLGLPDVVPMQDALMSQLQQKLSDNIRNLDPETLARTWIPVTVQGWSEMQKMFWTQMQGANAFRTGADSRETRNDTDSRGSSSSSSGRRRK